jgi:hypothetical protein
MTSPRREWIGKQSLKGIRLDETTVGRIYLDRNVSSYERSCSACARTFRGLGWVIWQTGLQWHRSARFLDRVRTFRESHGQLVEATFPCSLRCQLIK